MVNRYKVEVKYVHSDCCHSQDVEAQFDIYAKNEQHAWQRASEISQKFLGVYEVTGVNTIDAA